MAFLFSLAAGKRMVSVVLLFTAFCYSAFAGAWSARGHIAVTQQALNGLPTHYQDYFAELVRPLLKAEQKRKPLALHPLALASVLPDKQRHVPLAELFASYHASLPPLLMPYAKEDTSDWHYINLPYAHPDILGRCGYSPHISIGGQRDKMLRLLTEATTEKNSDERSRALLVVFAVHLIVDAYQPLHNMTAIDKHCQSDRGGNAVCVSWSKSRARCDWNLHRLWDVGGGYVDELWQQTRHALKDEKQDMIKQTKKYTAAAVYSFDSHILSSNYLNYVREVSEQQLVLAKDQIRTYLQRVYQSQHD